MSIDVAHLCDCIYASRRGLAALLILNGGNARPERRISRSTDSHVFFCIFGTGATDNDLRLND